MERFYTLKLIENHLKHFTPAEKKVALYIIKHPENVLDMTTKQLAAASKGSEAAIIRFCKRIGINSFKGLKIEIAKEMSFERKDWTKEVHAPLQFEDDLETILSKVNQKTIDALNKTEKLLSLEEFEKAITMLNQANKLLIYGAGGSSLVAQDLTQKLLRIDMPVFQSSDIHLQMVMAANMTKKDALFVVSTSGKTREVIKLLSVAKEKGAPTILLTQYGRSPAQRLSDICLNISDEEQNIRIGTMTARIAQLAVIDALFIGLCMKKGNKVFERIIDTHQAIQRIK